ncbi:MAG: T9SS C-terminal target domain-containing protein [Bacteroidetes bacterium]|nr:MAG: T9SS C-terminal target domain-containing protein [Bacteroidota bacterium]REK05808.1 MAG: T9SS C-terminal target domain-containing protein [Bacteroidota bacterium]REK31888.1 MAG: T9SS C-terminal target domain-containing protein [Bacteroidota bacterium]REK49953.1 MAG: T9SS C-terminal target domain-containing protein [Bacteroidota bacterium]
MKNLLLSCLLCFYIFNLEAQVVSVRPNVAVPGQSLTTVITLSSNIMQTLTSPQSIMDIYLKQGPDTIFTSSLDPFIQVYTDANGYTDSMYAYFDIPVNARLGWYEMHLTMYDHMPFPPFTPIPVDQMKAYGFLIRDPNSCTLPFNTSASSITNTSAQINWDASIVADTFRVRYSVAGSGQYLYKDVNGSGNPSSTILNNLFPGTNYTFEVSTICIGIHSTYSIIGNFTTTGTSVNCVLANGLDTSYTTNNSARIFWNNLVVADTFRIRYYMAGTSTYLYKDTAGSTGNAMTLSNLLPGTAYIFQVSSICNGVSSGYGNAFLFSTRGVCTVPTGLAASGITGGSAVLSWSQYVSANNFRIRYRESSGGPYRYRTVSGTNFSTTLNGLMPNTTYDCQVSSVCGGSGTGYSPVVQFTTSNSPVPCIKPFNTSAGPIGNVDATISWSNLVTADFFRIRYSVNGTTNYLYVTVPGASGSSAVIDRLVPNTTYQYQVSSICAGVSSGYSPSNTFTTNNSPASCITPYDLSHNSVSGSSANISWTNLVSADSFMVRYSVYGTTNYIWKKVSNVNNTVLTGLSMGTNYQWQVRSICAGVPVSVYSSPDTFITAPLRLKNNSGDEDKLFSVFPNPVRTSLEAKFYMSQSDYVNINVFDISGRIVHLEKLFLPEGNNNIEINTSSLAAGIYNLQIQNSSFRMVQRFIKE